MSKILITGANGFIGSFLVEEALKQGHEVFAGVRSTSNLKSLNNYRIQTLILDLSNPEKLRQKWYVLSQYFSKFDYVIHNAGATQAINSDNFELVNNQYTQNLLQSLVDANFMPKKFILMSSLAALGPGDPKTLAPIELEQTPQPITAYGRSKFKVEQYLSKQNDVPYLIFRPTAVYGPREKDFLTLFKAINRHLEPYISSPKQLLSFIYVKDLARLVIQSCSSDIANRSFIVSDGQTYTCKELSEITKKVLNKWTIPLVLPEIIVKAIAHFTESFAKMMNKTSVLNHDKFKELTSLNWSCNSKETQIAFNYTPEYKLGKGIEETINWYKQNNCL
ncbi:NAD(P)-dependent oxidoreductase [Ancylomarina euxinus]|uniref:NAD(P)-dependent oxidoreductase n=1 Tax=Ancylomarina euxinus TaxID=2283627 RepID=A0A425Y035_9BACT|nr:NAD(P)-dependent oxidoreductase [Ancylomarina euxinus]MCZ4695192.1 NAD(P)-dependent oxidoreductase [Ancylomarina euxinus]MUP15389.1 SDR family NAD(P)-dependent oxidoreductase [Ancylomarina euxinus]RRG21099.1 NAD(P)-dependent oxidoreductase [Ancylomarina euxinus]